MNENQPNWLKIDISVSAIIKILLTILVVYLLLRLAPILMLLFLSCLIAVALNPLVVMLERFISRKLAVVGVALVLGLLLFLIVLMIVPTLIEQVTIVVNQLPHQMQEMMSSAKPDGLFYKIGQKIFNNPDLPDLTTSVGQILTVGQFAIGGMTSLFLIFGFVVYLLLDGPRCFLWFSAFFSRETQSKIHQTVPEVSQLISAYMIGQGLASMMCGIFVYGLLTIFQVPAALMLGVLAAVLDVLPIVGFYISILPVGMFALTISPSTAALVVFIYWLYHLFEGYFILPSIYGKKLRLSGFSVLLGILCGVTLAGVLGAIAVLPIIASYPVIERIWLASYLKKGVIERHDKLEAEM